MKKIIFFTLALLTTVIGTAQDYPGEQVQLLLNKEVKVREIRPTLQQYGYTGFLTSPEITYKNIYKGTKTDKTPYNELVGKVFKVTEIIPYKNVFMLKLESSEIGTLYFNYDPKYASNYVFDVTGGLPTEFYCGKIESSNGTGNLRMWSPAVSGISLIKETINGKPTVMIRVVVFGDKPEVNKSGMFITLQNGRVIAKEQAKLDLTVENGFRYSSVWGLTNEDLKLLSESPIVSAKLYTFSEPVNSSAPIMHYARCLSK